MNILIVKLNAAGDVVRTTPLLRRLRADVTWITAAANLQLLKGAYPDLRCFSWEDRESAADRPFDLVINLEDELEPAAFVHHGIRHDRHFGAYLDDSGAVAYTDDSRGWFDMSLISVHGRKRADELKLQNRRSYHLDCDLRASVMLCRNLVRVGFAATWPLRRWQGPCGR
ncbi:MAG: hypothetical protein DMF90_17160 [Acidobacteria bacterium]|nr:MAG: hypothetical protein DMF90_17160 [Acidobacteriota bacterium]